ncbi:RNA polymerase II elongation factor ELL [Tupaia chinensis]|uniref:RNA polymerase II elongation factor ELL n=1 Tax=Tupaia chinensis TaxID=246437 RepID=L9KWS5_TUPCH|nr:RNA polymerase II elongation factor ELL [Tupaia chinensis]
MAALKEDRSYGLSCGRVSDGSKVSVFHVKLTDSALRAFESYRASQGAPVGGHLWGLYLLRFGDGPGRLPMRPRVYAVGPRGCGFWVSAETPVFPPLISLFSIGRDRRAAQRISIPQPDCPAEARTFSFYLSNIGRDSPQGSFDCIQQYVSRAPAPPGRPRRSASTYQKARQSMAQAEEETRSRSAIVIKPGGRYLGKKVQFRKPAPGATDAVPSRKRPTPMNLASAIRKSGTGAGSGGSGVSQRPFRDRVLHLLALRPYRKAELLLRLQKDGLTQADKDALDGLLQQDWVLGQERATLYPSVCPSWSASRCVSTLSPVAVAAPGDGHALLQVACVSAKDGTCSLRDCMYKDVQRDWPGYSEGDQQLLKRVLVRKLCQPPSSGSLPAEPAASSPPGEHGRSASPPQPGRAHSGPQRSKPKKKSKKHKDKDRAAEERHCAPRPADLAPATHGAPPDAPGVNGTCSSASVPTSTSETPDYLLKYAAICSSEQRQSYKNDFNAEYSEYRDLHARIERVTRRFTQLDAQLRQLSQGSEEYETTRGQILQEYRKIKKTNTNYSREKQRCEYLHSKLAHIKRRIAEFDQRQLQAWP